MTNGASDNGTPSRKSFRSGKPKALGVAVERVTKPLFGKRGLADGAVIRHWPAIVGPEFARFTAPEKLVFPNRERAGGTLHLRVASGSAATLIQHQEPAIVERINGFFGYRAVARLALRQGPLPTESPPCPPNATRPCRKTRSRPCRPASRISRTTELRAALQSLGRLVKVRSRDSSKS